MYRALTLPNTDGAEGDVLGLELLSAGALDGDLTGTFNLATGGDANYETCSRCLLVVADYLGTGDKYYFQQSGTLTIPAGSNHLNGTINATATDVTLVEVTIDGTTYHSTPVVGGECLHIASANVAAVLSTTAPATWTCDTDYFADGVCDCGCGAFDPDCDTPEVEACSWCDDLGSCSATDCPGTINPTNNAVCP